MIGIDTNILVRYFTQDDAEQAKAATEFLKSECTTERPGWVNRIALCELVWVLERVYRSSREEIANVLEVLIQTAEFQIEDLTCVWNALSVYRDENVDFSDALLAATNLAHGCELTITFDRKAANLPGMRPLPNKA